ncbi:NAD(P)/FAD-dependent oxidoreductase [Gilvimarinus sp. F26214L]|uniref:NAD(P)/FAD-dependent oxidoreductase n=1 Tax=Gilvimarinus sp. DZF01 TaxID=3461371 RepID=UPI004045E4CC
MNESAVDFDVVVIGAGPSGSVAATMLHNKGYRVHIVERQHFPRFSIGESLLPQCMMFLEEAGMLEDVHSQAEELGFQFKDGASFVRRDETTDFDFREKFTPGWGTTYQVQRANFDNLLARHAEKKGISIAWGHSITSADMSGELPVLGATDEDGNAYQLRARFVLDASGFGRILPRLLDLDRPSTFPSRTSLFAHVQDNITDPDFDRNKIRITVHPEHKDVWYWLIPFGGGRCSTGVVAPSEFFEGLQGEGNELLKSILDQDPSLRDLLSRAEFRMDARKIAGYASNVSTLWGNGFALLGNAGEFLDPVFSSGVTIAMKSASLACAALDRQFRGENVDWEEQYAKPLRKGVDCFRVFVDAWYDGRFQDIIFARKQSPEVREMICAILAGYAWDTNNPYVKDSERRMNTLAELCRSQ